jgi:RNA polymerase sigma-70 factor (TIGR02960 family)
VPVYGGGVARSDKLAIEQLEALRVPLTGYCYRLLGSAADTDDAVQETLIRASSRLDQYDPSRGRLSTWVHAIATNVCIDMLRSARRRVLAVSLDEAVVPGTDLGTPLPPGRWLEPMPDARLIAARDPAEVAEQRESVRLAFLVALQCLAPRQRAVLVLRDVLAFTAQETAEILGATVASVNSALQRARESLTAQRPDPFDIADPTGAEHRELLRRYVTAFEAHDIAGLKAILREDAVTSMPPFPWRMTGAGAIAELMGASDSCAGARLVPCRMNGAEGFGQYRPGDGNVLHPFALVAIGVRDGQIAQIVTFLGTQHRFREFGLPDSLQERGPAARLPMSLPAPRRTSQRSHHRRGRNPMSTSPAQLTGETQAERERLAALFADLSPGQWDTPSLCEGWRVREVVAHMTMPFRTKPLGVMAGMIRARFSFNRYADRDARSAAQDKSGAELADLLRRNIGNPWKPPGGGATGALSHDVIHGLDATEPLGLPAPPADRIALVLASAGPRQLRYFGVDLQGHRLTATDADVSVGDGVNVVPMTAKDILLIVTGRRPLRA